MRKYYAFLLFLSFFFQNLCAKQITLEEAFGLANRFFASVTSDRGSNTRTTSPVLTLAYTSVIPTDSKDTRAVSSLGLPTYYVFNADNDRGFVIVAADDRARSILAYSLTGSFGLENQPLQVRQWLSGYDTEIARLSEVSSVPGNCWCGKSLCWRYNCTYYDYVSCRAFVGGYCLESRYTL